MKMPNTDQIILKFLRELNSKQMKVTFESLGVLLEQLENKNDPDPVEMQIVDVTYQVLEKLKILEGILKHNVSDSNKELSGSKLQKLYDKKATEVGSQVFFD